MKYEVRLNGSFPLVVEASGEDEAKQKYETERGLVAGVNPLTVTTVTEWPGPLKVPVVKVEEEPKPKPPPIWEKPAEEPKVAEEVVSSEEVLVLE